MSNVPPQTPPPPKPRWQINVDGLVPYRRQIAIGLIVFGVAFAIIPITIAIRTSFQIGFRPTFIWAAIVSLANLILGGIGLGYSNEGKLTEAQKLRMLLLAAGSLFGMSAALLGFVLPLTVYQETLSKGMASWRENPGALLWPGLALIGGLALMFFSLQLGRGMERQHATVRRVIYGFNAVLMSLLLLAVLAIPNVLAYAEPFSRYFGRPYDWTANDVNSISPALRSLLSNLEEPVKVYVMLATGTIISQDTKTMLENCRSLTSQLSIEYVDPSARSNLERVDGLMRKYAISDPQGLLIIRGTESDEGKSDFTFVKVSDLFSRESAGRRGADGGMSYSFLGENALYTALVELIEGKLVFYFTQGHGEFSLESNMPQMPGMPPPRRPAGDLTVLKQKLTGRKSVEVKPLKLDRSLKQVPDDASVVVVVRPTQTFAPDEAKLLLDYVRRPGKTRTSKSKDGRERQEEEVTAGKLILLFDPVTQKQGGRVDMAPTGLESLLAAYNVKLGNDRVLSASSSDPLEIIAVTNPSSSNPVAKAFNSANQQTIFRFRPARTVDSAGQHPGVAVERLILVPTRQLGIWAETNLEASAAKLAADIRDDPDLFDKKVPREPLCLAVAVSETSGAAPQDFAHAAVNKETPRLLVFGSADWLNDEGLNNRDGGSRVDLFNSCVSWIREKSSIGKTIEGKERKKYEPNIAEQDQNRLVFLPLALMALAVVGLGTGVWVVRRR